MSIISNTCLIHVILNLQDGSVPASLSDASSVQGLLMDDLNDMAATLKMSVEQLADQVYLMKDTLMIWSSTAGVTTSSYMGVFQIKWQAIWTLKILS